MQMADWLIVQGVPAKLVRIEAAKTFNTEGEQDAAISCGYGHEIHTSAWWQLPRIMVMRLKRGVSPGTKVSYRPCWGIPPLKGGLLEIGKFFICLLLPKKQQQALAYKVKKFIRTSY